MPAYEPQPGTIAARAIPVLDALVDGEMLSSSELAEKIGCDSHGLSAYLDTAAKHGRVKRERRERLVFWGRGDPGTPSQPEGRALRPGPASDHPWRSDLAIPTFDGRVPKAPKPKPELASAPSPTSVDSHRPIEPVGEPMEPLAPIAAQPEHAGPAASFADLMEAAEAAADDALEQETDMRVPPLTMSVPEPEPPAPAAPTLFALWSDGRLEIRARGLAVILEKAEVDALDEYLFFGPRGREKDAAP